MIDDQLLVGIVLIAAGVAIGLLAYALVLNRREAAAPAETEIEAEVEEQESDLTGLDQVGAQEEVGAMPEPPEAQADRAAEPAIAAKQALGEGSTAPEQVAGETDEDLAQPITGMRHPIATLMRDDRTGRLALKVGDREYANPWELKGTADWTNVEQASTDLATWLSEVQPPEAGSGKRTKKAVPASKSLVDEVNEILEVKLAESGLTHRGVRLSEGSGGSVRVYIGIQSYTMDEIPDAEIREVIRQAVAEWEDRK
jgi:hypothetical protein